MGKEDKYKLVSEIKDEVSLMKKKYRYRMIKYKRLDNYCEITVNVCNGIAVSSMIITIALIGTPYASFVSLGIGTTFTFISSILSVLKKSLDYSSKYQSCRTTYNQLSQLERDIKEVLIKNNLSSEDIQILLHEINVRLSMIEDTSMP